MKLHKFFYIPFTYLTYDIPTLCQVIPSTHLKHRHNHVETAAGISNATSKVETEHTSTRLTAVTATTIEKRIARVRKVRVVAMPALFVGWRARSCSS